jgi:hypothetical protein
LEFTGKEIWAILPKLKLKVSLAKEPNGEPEETKPEDVALLSQIFDDKDESGDSGEPDEEDNDNPVKVNLDDKYIEDDNLDIENEEPTENEEITEVFIRNVKETAQYKEGTSTGIERVADRYIQSWRDEDDKNG